jgi:hypothetical protein
VQKVAYMLLSINVGEMTSCCVVPCLTRLISAVAVPPLLLLVRGIFLSCPTSLDSEGTVRISSCSTHMLLLLRLLLLLPHTLIHAGSVRFLHPSVNVTATVASLSLSPPAVQLHCCCCCCCIQALCSPLPQG